ncbi:MAG: PilT/PilU family type 4a pilus ATPase [Clostridiales bacterium]|nr:PilT/PilU family type 4a pilus ATPase [Clostridiales bacterium]MBP5493000.1 PilT/PilU family type 4a pilus ATPase [Clostridiales bacterium]
MTFEQLMDYAVEQDCSDVHITVGTNLAVRRYGVLHILDARPTAEESLAMIYTILSDEEIKRVEAGEDLDLGLMIDNEIRIRANVYHQRNNLACSIRLLMAQIPEFEDLGLPEVLKSLATAKNGIILVTGPTGSGKTTTLSAIVDYINKNEAKHIITIEDPIEYLYPHNRAMIHQRELHRDTPSFASALHSSLREDPDIIMVGEMRDFETISAAITAAETGHLVLSTLHTQSAGQTINRVIDGCPIDKQATIRAQFASNIRAVLSQQLLPVANGNGRVLTTELMIGTNAIKNLIIEDKIVQIPGLIQSGKSLGMHTLNEDLVKLYKSGYIKWETALEATYDVQDLEKTLGVTPPSTFDEGEAY